MVRSVVYEKGSYSKRIQKFKTELLSLRCQVLYVHAKKETLCKCHENLMELE